jgi:translation initiation factor 3 subunit D
LNSWGPPDEVEDLGNLAKFKNLPYSPFGRSDRLGRAADFSSSARTYGAKSGAGSGGTTAGGGMTVRNSKAKDLLTSAVALSGESDEEYQLVDTTKTTQKKAFVNPASKRQQHSIRLRQINARRQQSQSTMDRVMTGRAGARGGVGGGRAGSGGGRGGRAGGRGGRGGFYIPRVDRQPSVAVQPDWKSVEELDLSKFTKNLSPVNVPPPEDVLFCGFLDEYNDVYDKVNSRAPVPLKRMERKEFYPVTTTDDPVMEKLAIDQEAQVFITDVILAHLMTCTRSVYPWDIVIQKLPGGVLFFDKRDNSAFDYLTVCETAHNPPQDEDGYNTPERLALEATIVNQNFSQQILRKNARTHMTLPNPFFDEEDNDGMEPASVAFRYRKFTLDNKITVLCRTELHGIVKKSQYMTAFALNEYTPTIPSSNVVAWRDKIDSQRGAVLATELKNNSFKLAKWTAQSILAGADQMKIGFVSRSNPKLPHEHVILATQFYRPVDFAQQITLQESQMWSVFGFFVNLLLKQEDGKYVLMRHPNKPTLQLFQVPPNTFDDEE